MCKLLCMLLTLLPTFSFAPISLSSVWICTFARFSVCLLQNCIFFRFTSPLTLDCICRSWPPRMSFPLSFHQRSSSASSLSLFAYLRMVVFFVTHFWNFKILFVINISYDWLFHQFSRIVNLHCLVQPTNCCGTSGTPESLKKLCVSVATPFYVSRGSLRLFSKSPNLASAVSLFFRDAPSQTLYQILPNLQFTLQLRCFLPVYFPLHFR